MIIRLITERTDASIGLRLAGIETVCRRDAQSLNSALDESAADSRVGVLLITPGVERLCPDAVSLLRGRGKPVLLTVPDSDSGFENTNVISDYVENAIGIKIE